MKEYVLIKVNRSRNADTDVVVQGGVQDWPIQTESMRRIQWLTARVNEGAVGIAEDSIEVH